jgi:ElaA protein
MQDITFSCCSFAELAPAALYEILQLRSQVFVVEQDCVYLDPDGNDQLSLHVSGRVDDSLVCYARLLPPGCKYPHASIGRVVTSQAVRRTGYGRALMQQAITCCGDAWPDSPISISAQQYLEAFYQEFGFSTVSQPYMEDGIPHLEMLLQADSNAPAE